MLEGTAKSIATCLPERWEIELTSPPRADRGYDAVLEIRAPDGRIGRFVVEAKFRLEPRDVARILERLDAASPDTPLVVAPYLSPRARELITEAAGSYADTTGNIRIALAEPALYIERQGSDSNPWPEERSLQSLKGPTSGRVVRALCELEPPYGIRELAEASATPVATVARVIELLDTEAIIERTSRGPVTAVDWAALIRRWVRDYTFTDSNNTVALIEPRGLEALIAKLKALEPGKYAVTGSLAASQVKPIAPPRLATVFVASLPAATEQLDLRPTETGANVILAEPYNDVVFERTWTRDSVVYAALPQVAADLLTGPGRAPAEAEELMRWMQDNEDDWRTQP